MQEKQKKWILRIALYLIWNYGAGTRYHTEYEDEPRRIAHHLHAVRRGTDLRL